VKLLLWTVVIALVVMWLMRKKTTPSATSTTSTGACRDTTEAMSQCAYCRVHFPASEAVTAPTGAAYCSDEHRVLHAR
jgi:uncharacterized protein